MYADHRFTEAIVAERYVRRSRRPIKQRKDTRS